MNNINQKIKELEATLVSLKAKAKAKGIAKAQEPTLTPVSFESKAELAKALLDGRTFKTTGGYTLMYNDSYLSPFRLMRDGEDQNPMLGTWDSYDNLQEINAAPQPWYLNIPKGGIECYVSDDDPNPSLIKVIIREYNSRLSFPFRSSLLRWKFATPVNGGK